MLLIGFVWVLVSTAASLVVGVFLPRTRWEDHGPTVMMVVATASFFGGMLGAVLSWGHLGYTGEKSADPTLGVALSLAAAAVAFGGYVVDVKKNQAKRAA